MTIRWIGQAVFAFALLGAAPGMTQPAGAQTAGSTEYTTFHPLWYRAGAVAEGQCEAMGLLNRPAGWSAGDGAAVIMTARELRDATRDPLVAALLQEGAAVLEIVSSPTVRCAGDHRETSRLAPLPDPGLLFREALDALGRVAGAGLVVAIGYRVEGEAALAVARAEAANRRPGADAPRYAAAAAIGAGEPRFALGAMPDGSEQWTARASRFCAALGQAVGNAEGRGSALRVTTACTSTLIPSATAAAPGARVRRAGGP